MFFKGICVARLTEVCQPDPIFLLPVTRTNRIRRDPVLSLHWDSAHGSSVGFVRLNRADVTVADVNLLRRNKKSTVWSLKSKAGQAVLKACSEVEHVLTHSWTVCQDEPRCQLADSISLFLLGDSHYSLCGSNETGSVCVCPILSIVAKDPPKAKHF